MFAPQFPEAPAPPFVSRPKTAQLARVSGVVTHWETRRNMRILRLAQRLLPPLAFNALANVGVWIAVLILPTRRANSQRYLATVLTHAVTWRDVRRHYRAFLAMQGLRLRVADGHAHHYRAAHGCDDFVALMRSSRPALLGTFHLGNSDLLGFFLGQFQRHVHMVRFRLGDPELLREVAQTFGAWVSFIWVNEEANLLFALKQAIDSGGTVAMKCDRDGYSARRESFEFLGTERSFPFTIYHLGILFMRPVTFCIGVPVSGNETAVHGFPVFEPDAGSKDSNMRRAREHFRGVLRQIEALLRAQPYLWFNFEELTPAPAKTTTSGVAAEEPIRGAVAVAPSQGSAVVVS